MKNWNMPEIEELAVKATANQPTPEVSCDDIVNGVFTFGKRDGSGPKSSIGYQPTDGQ